ncbi:hypothetical protein NPIL_595501 [Nephila pilipes]|uniref:Uncharacterized protein n=1 Tax=Nephila pilipes TaxID=299642 RepID=A0A8X6N0Y4_NEPPI|nr:hypothetical protein NPIL_595501 [Nephila pilipes]
MTFDLAAARNTIFLKGLLEHPELKKPSIDLYFPEELPLRTQILNQLPPQLGENCALLQMTIVSVLFYCSQIISCLSHRPGLQNEALLQSALASTVIF